MEADLLPKTSLQQQQQTAKEKCPAQPKFHTAHFTIFPPHSNAIPSLRSPLFLRARNVDPGLYRLRRNTIGCGKTLLCIRARL